MKKIVITLIIILCSFSSKAQDAKIIGNWLLIKVEVNAKVHEPYQIITYKADGSMEVMGMDAGTWKYDKKGNTIIIKSDFFKEVNGENKIVSLTNNKLIVTVNEAKVSYKKLDSETILKENTASGLVGEWKIENEFNDTQLLKIELPDTFVYTEVSSGGSSSTSQGTWMYNPKEKSVVFIGRLTLLKGKNTLKALSKDQIVIEKNGLEIIGKKQTSTANNSIERLTFGFEEFPEEPNEYSPWTDFYALLQGLENVAHLKYKKSKLIPNTTSFEHSTLLSKVNVNLGESSISLANFWITQNDTIQYSESVKGSMYNKYNDFFPQEEPGPFRMITTETITVLAGEFMCKVFEGFDGEAKVKYWMIIDKPGIYAKIIREDVDSFDDLEYSIIELEEVKKSE